MAKKLKDEDLVLNIIINGDKSKREMQELERAITDTNKEIRQLKQQQKDLVAQGKKETEAYKAATQAIKDKEAAVTMAEARLSQLRKGMKLTEMTTGDLKREMQRLKRLLDNTMPNDPNYKKYKEQLEAVKSRIDELSDSADNAGFSFRKLADNFNHYIGVITAGIVTLVSLISGINMINNTFAEFDDKVADVQKTTGLFKDEVLELNEELKKIDTRTTQEDLLGLSRVAGKLGISAKDDVLGFVRAADQIGVALSEDLGGDVEEAINQVGKLVDIFDLKKEFGIEQGLLKVGSAINSLGASSTANEGYLVNFTNRMAGVAPLAGITIDQILGLGATLDQFGQTSEVSSTALSKLFMNMSADAKTYSKYAGQSVDQFKKNLESDFMGTFIKVLEGVKSSSSGINDLVKTLGDLGEDGGRVVGVLGVLANNTGTLRTQLDLANKSFNEGTSLTEEFAIKNETAAAKLDKAKKSFYNLTVELGEKLSGAVTLSANGLTRFVKVLSIVITFITEHRKVLSVILAAIIAYNAALLVQSIYLQSINTQSKLNLALFKLQYFWMQSTTAATHLLNAAYLLMRGRLQAAKAEMIAFNAIVKTNPIGILVAALAAVGMALYFYTQKLTAAQKAQMDLNEVKQKANESISDEKEKIKQLLSTINAETATRAQKLSAIKSIREIMPGYLQAYKDEEILAGKAATAIALYVKEMERRALVDAGTRKMAELQNKREEIIAKQKAGYKNLSDGEQWSLTLSPEYFGVPNAKAFEIEMKRQIAEVDTSYEQLSKRINGYAASVFDSSTIEGMQSQADYLISEMSKLKKAGKENTNEYQAMWDQMKELNKQIAFRKAHPEKQNSTNIGLSEDELKKQAKEREKNRKAEIAEENKAYEQRLKDAGLFGLQRSLMTQEQLEQLAEIEKIHQQNINAINKKGQKISLEQASLALAEIRKRQEAEHKYRLKLINPESEEIEQENEAHAQRLEKAGLFGKKRERLTAEQLSALEKLEAIHRDKLDKIDADLITKHLQKKQQSFETELAQIRFKNHEELAQLNSLEKAKKLLQGRLTKDELLKINSISKAKKALKEVQLKEENAITLKYGQDLSNQIKSTIDTGFLNFDDLKLSDKILSKEEYEVLKAQFLKLSEMMAGLKMPSSDKVKEDYSFGSGKADILGFTPEDWDYFFSNLAQGKFGIGELALAVGALTQAWSVYDQFRSQSENKQLKEFEASTNAQKEKLQEKLDKGTISQKKYNSDVAKLDKDLDAKKQKIEEAQAARQKVLAIGNVISSTAQAIMSIWAQVPKFDFGISAGILTGIVSGVGAAQLAMIMGLEEGGYVQRAQDGKRFKAKNRGKKRGYIDETSILVSENGSEFVASAQAVANPDVKEVLDIIDSAQKNGTISTLTLEKLIYSPPIRTVKGKETGGYTANSTDSTFSTPQSAVNIEMLEFMKQTTLLYKKLTEKLERPLKAEVSLLGDEGFIKKMEEYNSTVESSTL